MRFEILAELGTGWASFLELAGCGKGVKSEDSKRTCFGVARCSSDVTCVQPRPRPQRRCGQVMSIHVGVIETDKNKARRQDRCASIIRNPEPPQIRCGNRLRVG